LGPESLKKNQTTRTGFKSNPPWFSKNKLQHIQLSDTTETLWSNKKKVFLAANPPDVFGGNSDKK